MTRERWISIGSVAAALGGLSWLAKVAVIIATDGQVNDEGAAATGEVWPCPACNDT